MKQEIDFGVRSRRNLDLNIPVNSLKVQKRVRKQQSSMQKGGESTDKRRNHFQGNKENVEFPPQVDGATEIILG